MVPASAYDVSAPSFERHRGLPSGVPEAIRAAVLSAAGTARPRLLDLGAGNGLFGWPFVAADDDYVGVDRSLGMLREFARRVSGGEARALRLAQTDGEQLPFRDATFDAVLLIRVIRGAPGWRRVVLEARRVLRPGGVLVIGHSVRPPDGIDAKMKVRLAAILEELGVGSYHRNTRDGVQPWLESEAKTNSRICAAVWTWQRTPRAFRERRPTGSRFSMLPKSIQDRALDMLDSWAVETFGSLDARFEEQHEFELQVLKFQ